MAITEAEKTARREHWNYTKASSLLEGCIIPQNMKIWLKNILMVKSVCRHSETQFAKNY